MALKWPSTLRSKMRSSNWIFSLHSYDDGLLMRRTQFRHFCLTICFYQHIHHVLKYQMLTRPIIACQAFLPINAKQVPSRVSTRLPQLIHSGSTCDDLIRVSWLFYSAIKYSVVSRVISVTHVINQSAESKRGKWNCLKTDVVWCMWYDWWQGTQTNDS